MKKIILVIALVLFAQSCLAGEIRIRYDGKEADTVYDLDIVDRTDGFFWFYLEPKDDENSKLTCFYGFKDKQLSCVERFGTPEEEDIRSLFTLQVFEFSPAMVFVNSVSQNKYIAKILIEI